MATNDLHSAGTTPAPEADPVSGGTTSEPGADGERQPNAETPEQQEIARLRAANDELLRMKSNAEETNRENERLRLEREALLSRQQPPTTGQQQGEYAARLQQGYLELQQRAAEGDNAAVLQLALLSAMQQTPQVLTQRIDMLEVPQDDRGEVERIQREAYQRGESINAKTARRLLEADRLAKKAAQVDKQARELAEAQAAKERGVVRTGTVGIPASEVAQARMTRSQFATAWDNATPAQRDELLRKTNGGTNLVPG